MDDHIRVGILGPGRIVERVYKDFHQAKGLVITAVGSRDLSRAQDAAEKYGAVHAFGSYEELAACGDVDLIYIATPHNFHKDQAILCMNHGKHVLCEKPMALNDAETQAMIDCAKKNDVFLMEAMWTRLFPATRKLDELLKEGAIGKPIHMTTDFCFRAEYDPTQRLFSRQLAGGALLDVGIYTMAATSLVFGSQPVRVDGVCQKAKNGVDSMCAITTQYAGGETAQQLCGFSAVSEHRMLILGERGRILVPDFWHPTRIEITMNNGAQQALDFEPENEGFRHEFMHVRECILNGLKESPIVPLKETLALSGIMTDLRRRFDVRYPEEV